MSSHHGHHEEHTQATSDTFEYLKFTMLIVVIITLSNFTYYFSDSLGLMDWLRWFMGYFLVIFSTFKFIGYKMFVEMFPMYDLLAMRSKLYAKAYPFIELLLGLLFLFDVLFLTRTVSVLFFMGVGALGIVQTVYMNKKKIRCACLGNVIKLPLSTVSLVEDVGMVVMAFVMLLIY